MTGEQYEIYTFEYLMELALDEVPDTMDKRQGSIIYDALAPACYRLAEIYQNIRNVYKDTNAETASGEDLDNIVKEQGLQRYAATYAIKKVYIADTEGNPMSIPLDSRFSTISDINPITYRAVSVYSENGQGIPGYYEMECEVAGSIGNQYAGALTQITNIRGVGSATMSTVLVTARDEETDDELRTRYFETINSRPFGGNIAQYKEQVRDITRGPVQVYPVWAGAGTVKVSILDADKNICTPDVIASVQNKLDPENAAGDKGSGLGLAPIGHRVTVVAPEEVSIKVSFALNLKTNYEISQIKDQLKAAVNNYLYELREEWDDADSYGQYSLSVYRARVTSALITVEGVDNVSNLILNDADSDIVLSQTGEVQQIPKLGDIVVNGVVI